GQAGVHAAGVQRGVARRHVLAARGVRSGAAREPVQGRSRAVVPGVAGHAGGSSGRRVAVTSSVSASSGAAVRDQLLEVRERGTPVRIVGGGTWLDAGRPVDATATVDVSAHAGIVEYVPGDVTL